MAKIFVGGLSLDTQTEDLIQHFEQFGELTDAVVMSNRGFGFVTYADPDHVTDVFGLEHVIKGKIVELKPADGKRPGDSSKAMYSPRGTQNFAPPAPVAVSGAGGKRAKEQSSKIFIGGLGDDITEEDLVGYMSSFGNIIDHVIFQGRGFGFVTFDNPESADSVMELGSQHEINECMVEVKKSVPKEQMAAASNGGTAKSNPPHAGKGSFKGGSFKGGGKPAARKPSYGTKKIFCGGLSAESTTEDLTAYFSQYGDIVDAIAMDGRGFGFVEFDQVDCVDYLMQHVDSHQINGKWIDVKPSIPREQMAAKGAGIGAHAMPGGGNKGGMHGRGNTQAYQPYSKGKGAVPTQAYQPYGMQGGSMKGMAPRSGPRPTTAPHLVKGGTKGSKPGKGKAGSTGVKKIFVGGLDPAVTTDHLIEYFSVYGTLVDAIVMKDRGFGFVEYDQPDAVAMVFETPNDHHICGKWVEIKPSDGLKQQKGGKGGGFRPY